MTQETEAREVTNIARERDEAIETAETYRQTLAANELYCIALTDRAEKAEAENAELRSRLQEWRSQLLDAWANDHRATMTALLEGGPSQEKS